MGRRDAVVDFKFAESPHLSKAVFKDRLDHAEPIIAQIRSMRDGHVAKSFQCDFRLGCLNCHAVSGSERNRLE